MQKGKFVRYLLFVVAVLCFASCEYDTITFEDIVIPPDDEITFSESIIPIFNSKCVECHNGSIKLDLRSDKAYDALISGDYIDTDSPADSELYKTLTGGHSSASPSDRAVILKWIELGAKND